MNRQLILIVFIAIFSTAQPVYSQTELKGTITKDSTLSLSASPYFLGGNLTVKNNAVLKIEAGVVLDLKSYNIYVGSVSAAKLYAAGADIKSSSTGEKYIDIKDGGKVYVRNCSFDRVFFKIENDAGDTLQFISNHFENVSWPVNCVPTKLPEISGSNSGIETIGIYGTVEEDVTLPSKGFSYTLTSNLNIRNNAVFHITSEVTFDLNRYSLNIGYSTPGKLEADHVYFVSGASSVKYIYFKDGGFGSITNCHLTNVAPKVENDAAANINITNNTFTGVDCPVYLAPGADAEISNNICTNGFIGLFSDLEEDKTLRKYEWDYRLMESVHVKKGASISFEPGINIDLNKYTFYIGSGTSGIIQASGVNFTNSTGSSKPVIIQDLSSGTIASCNFNNVYIKIEKDASNDISITGNQFENTEFPVLLSANRAPAISGNIADEKRIGLFGEVTQNNTLQKYDWDYALYSNITIKGNTELNIDTGVKIDLLQKQIQLGVGSSNDHCVLNAGNVTFMGAGNNKGILYFYKNSFGTLINCRFEKVYIKINDGAPAFSYCRFFHSQTAVEVMNESSPVFVNNDFYNNLIAVKYTGLSSLNMAGNYWGHPGGPAHEANPEGLGETITGNVSFSGFLTEPATGTVSGTVSPLHFEFGTVNTGVQIDTFFTITNHNEIDLLIPGIKTHTSNISVRSPDRFWILPDSSRIIPFTFTSLAENEQSDTLVLLSNDSENPMFNITMTALGQIDSLRINFYKMLVDSFPLVKVYFTVTDQAGIPIAGITKEMLNVVEETTGIDNFELISKTNSTAPVAASIVIDRSGSMIDQPIRDAKNAAIDLISNFKDNDIANVISFAGDVTLHTPFTSNLSVLTSAVNSIRADGSTALYSAIMAAIDTLKNQPGNRAVVALSDGKNNTGFSTPLDIVTLAMRHNITIYTIGLGDDIDESALRYIATTTGGQYFHAPTSEMLSIIYRIISGTFQSSYVLRYSAPETGPVIRTLYLTIDYHGLSVTDSIRYSTEKQEIDFAIDKPVFMLPEFYKNSKSYFYCAVNDPGGKLIEGQEFSFIQDKSIIIPCTGKYLGNSIFQFYIDFPEDIPISSLKFVFPDSILNNGSYIRLKNKPATFTVPVLKPAKTETIDVFAGGSLGATLLAGAAGAGPSVAAASLSAEGTAGMGLTFEMNSEREEYITRRLEAGIGESVESPAINSVIGDVQAGVKAGVSVKGIVGQTMEFPTNMSSLEKKAKTLYLLETFSLGAVSLAPDCSLLKQALHLSLSELNGGIMDAYDNLYYAEMYGINIEGTASAGASFALNKKTSDKDQNKLNLAEVGVGLTFSGRFTNFMQQNNKNKELEFGVAFDGGFSLLELNVMGLDLGSLYGYSFGADMSLGANFHPSTGLNSIFLNFGLNENEQLVFNETNNRREFGISVPKKVIDRALNNDDMITSILPFLNPDAPLHDFTINKNHFIESAGNFFNYATGPLDDVSDHVLIETSNTKSYAAEIGVSVEVDAALIIGGGLELGVTLGYAEDETYPDKTYTVANGSLLPLVEHGDPPQTNLLSLKDEIEFLFKNVPSLVKDMINSLIEIVDQMIEEGEEFVLSTFDNACSLAGNFYSAGSSAVSGVVGTISSYTPGFSIYNPLRSAYLDPVIIEGYTSSRVVPAENLKNRQNAPNQGFLCIVSDCYRILLHDNQDSVIDAFEPLMLKIALNQKMLQEFGLSEDEKSMAAIYFYDNDSLNWYEVPGDLNTSPDTVATMIEHGGTYAVGIMYDKTMDKEAPEILNFYPADGAIYSYDSLFFARLYEPPLGAGIDLSGTSLKIDGKEMEAFWDPVNNILSYKPGEPLLPGLHTFEIIASDKNGNVTVETNSFTVNSTPALQISASPGLMVECYPNPANSYIRFEIKNCVPGKNYTLTVFDVSGKAIKQIFHGTINETQWNTTWNLTTQSLNRVKPGVYFLRIKSNEKILVKKIAVN